MSVIERLLGRSGGDVTPGDVTISRMRRRDLRGGVLAIEAQSYPRPWSHAVFGGELEQVRSGSRHYVVARRLGTIVGYAGLWFTGDEAHVTNIAVDPRVRRQGIARRLMSALAAEVVERGCTGWTLEVRVSSEGAQELYRAFGFEPAGVRTRYYENVEDAIVMWCHDVQTVDYRRRLDEIRQGEIDAR
ncbi:MAG: ribosomal protein S18-alanine N-acetyltransferase [Ilumatobacter sp.]|nr:ribosomal protein S18-alanine N-acetyltransferase [Ilumatobacter sp.]